MSAVGGDQPAGRNVDDLAARVVLIERSILLGLLLALCAGVVAVVKPFTTALLFGGIVATALWPLRQFLVGRGVRRGWAAMLLLGISAAVILVPILVIAPRLSERLLGAEQRFEAYFETMPAEPEWLTSLPLVGHRLDVIWDKVAAAQGDIHAIVQPYTSDIEKVLVRAAGALADSVLQVLLALIVATMFWAHGEALVAAMHDAFRLLGGPLAEAAIGVMAGAVRGVAYGLVGTALLQATILTLGLAIAGVPGATMLGFVGLLLALSQIGGPLLIVISLGSAWWLFGQGSDAWGVFMIVWGLFVSTADNFLRPWLIGFGMQMPLSLTILGVFGGFVSFGFLGLFIGPTLIAVAFTLIKAWRDTAALNPPVSRPEDVRESASMTSGHRGHGRDGGSADDRFAGIG
jgi:predicted PurR-regulated permease PerM